MLVKCSNCYFRGLRVQCVAGLGLKVWHLLYLFGSLWGLRTYRDSMGLDTASAKDMCR